ncbi:hypothetical protein GCM10009430_16320 [Aquimarina litoralis]|uniref:SH3 domain-containing protein n=1 Tax=Aquimarina litoralis TaxID=584605 RepID=A0ABN1IP42_9FLAO
MLLDKMMFIRVFTITICILTYVSGNAQNDFFVTAKNGLNVRSEDNLSAKKVAKIPYGVIVQKIADTDREMTIIDNGIEITGKWVKIKYNNYPYIISNESDTYEKEGFVFDGYLKKNENDAIITSSRIPKTEYDELFKKASKPIEKSKKIGDLDSIKTILKNRVEWVTQFENEDYKREDQIKSITISNGQKLILNEFFSEEIGFSKGWSGYYPAYDILVLEGGHTSDRTFSIKTGETEGTIGNPDYFVHSPQKTIRLNGIFGGQECISYFFQRKVKGEFEYLTAFDMIDDHCIIKEFYWINETSFIYRTKYYSTDEIHGETNCFKGQIKLK